MPPPKPLHRRPSALLTARDFVYVYEPGLGQTYQNGPYMIRPLPYGYSQGYRVYYRGGPMLTMTETFLSAIDACARHEALANQVPSLYTQRCERIERGLSRHQEGK